MAEKRDAGERAARRMDRGRTSEAEHGPAHRDRDDRRERQLRQAEHQRQAAADRRNVEALARQLGYWQ